MEFVKKQWVTYVPVFDGIRERWLEAKKAEAQPVGGISPELAFEVHPLSAKEFRALQAKVVVKVRKDGEVQTPNGEEVEKANFCANVRPKEPFATVKDGDSGTVVTLDSAAVIWDAAPPALVQELQAAITEVSRLTGGERQG